VPYLAGTKLSTTQVHDSIVFQHASGSALSRCRLFNVTRRGMLPWNTLYFRSDPHTSSSWLLPMLQDGLCRRGSRLLVAILLPCHQVGLAKVNAGSAWSSVSVSVANALTGSRDFGFAGPLALFLLGPSFVDNTSMTIESCVEFCDQQNNRLAGIEAGNECRKRNIFYKILQGLRVGVYRLRKHVQS
jgi:WSC domain